MTRTGGSHVFPSEVTVREVDYDSLESLTSAFQGQDAVVSTIASASIGVQLRLIEAATKAGVKRFVPSEFGSNTLNVKTGSLPVYKDKITVQDALAKASASSNLSYTLIINGPFLDWGIMVGFIMNVRDRNITLFDGGDRLFSTTSLPTIGKAVVGVLKHPEDTKNRAVYVQDTALNLKKLLDMGRKATRGEWTEKTAAIDDVLGSAWAELQKEAPDPDKFVFNFLQAGIWGEGYGAHYEKLDNQLLGIQQMSDHEVQNLVTSYAAL